MQHFRPTFSKNITLLIAIWTFSSLLAMANTNMGIRYDYQIIGNADTTFIVHKQTSIYHFFHTKNLICEKQANYGNFRYQLFNLNENTPFFQRGFSPLFSEWQTTTEAATKFRAFPDVLYFPQQQTDAILIIEKRNKAHQWISIFTDTIKANDLYIQQHNAYAYPIDTLLWSGSPADKINLAILPDGYTHSEMEKFIADATRLTDSLFAAHPFKKFRDRFNIFAVQVPSQQSGTDIPSEGIFNNTAFHSTFDTFGSARYLTSSALNQVHDALQGVPFDQVYLLVNTNRYGGGGMYNQINICSSDHLLSPFVFIHEFGHGFAALADEYFTADTLFNNFYPLYIEPWEPNISTLVNFEEKWGHMLADDIPIPTPRTQKYQHCIGVFEGGGYQAKGVYSPAQTCWMKERAAGGFCPVCQAAIEAMIISLTKKN